MLVNNCGDQPIVRPAHRVNLPHSALLPGRRLLKAVGLQWRPRLSRLLDEVEDAGAPNRLPLLVPLHLDEAPTILEDDHASLYLHPANPPRWTLKPRTRLEGEYALTASELAHDPRPLQECHGDLRFPRGRNRRRQIDPGERAFDLIEGQAHPDVSRHPAAIHHDLHMPVTVSAMPGNKGKSDDSHERRHEVDDREIPLGEIVASDDDGAAHRIARGELIKRGEGVVIVRGHRRQQTRMPRLGVLPPP